MKRILSLLIGISLASCPAWAVQQAELSQIPDELDEVMRSSETELVEQLNGWQEQLAKPQEFTAEDIDYTKVYPVYQNWDGKTLSGMDDPENATWILPVQAGEEQIWLEFYVKQEIPEDVIPNLTKEELEQEQAKVGKWIFGGSSLMEADYEDYQTMMDQYAKQGKISEDSDYVLAYADAHGVLAVIREHGKLTGAIPLDPIAVPSKGHSEETTLEVGTVYNMEEVGSAMESIQAEQMAEDPANAADQRDGGNGQQAEEQGVNIPLIALAVIVLGAGAFLLRRRRAG